MREATRKLLAELHHYLPDSVISPGQAAADGTDERRHQELVNALVAIALHLDRIATVLEASDDGLRASAAESYLDGSEPLPPMPT